MGAAVTVPLMRIEAINQAIGNLPINPRVLANLRETARLFSTHYSTMIEGNRLTQAQVVDVIGRDKHFPGRERDQEEVKGYYAALDAIDDYAKSNARITEASAQKLHALVMSGGRRRAKPTPYRDGQNVIREGGSRRIITARQLGELFGYRPRTVALLCQRWVKEGFLHPTNRSRKARRYALAERYRVLA